MTKDAINTGYEDGGLNKKKGLGDLIGSYGKLIQANMESKTIENEGKVLNKRLNNSFLEEINEIAKNAITLSYEDIKSLEQELRFQELPTEQKKEIIDMFTRRVNLNSIKYENEQQKERTRIEKETNLKKIRESREEMIGKLMEKHQKAEQHLVNKEYEKALQTAEEVLEDIQYEKETTSKIKSFLNSKLLRLKRAGEMFSKEKSIMTTSLLPNGIDIVLIEMETRAKTIKGIAQEKMKEQTKEKKINLSRNHTPKETPQEVCGVWKPIRQGQNIVGFENGYEILNTKQKLYRSNKNIYITQQKGGDRFALIGEDGKKLIGDYFTKDFQIKKDKFRYQTTPNGNYKDFDLA